MTFLKTIKSVGSTAGKSIRPNVIRFDYKQIPPVVINHEVSVKHRDSLAEKRSFPFGAPKHGGGGVCPPPSAMLPGSRGVDRSAGATVPNTLVKFSSSKTFVTSRGGRGRHLNSFPSK